MNGNTEDFDDFVFKPAATSPHATNNSNISSNSSSSSDGNLSHKSNNTIDTTTTTATTSTTIKTNPRLPALDAFISEKKREMDSELNKLGKERLEEFLKREKQAELKVDEEEEEGFIGAMNTMSSSVTRAKKDYTKLAAEIDEKEAEILKNMREKAKETWQELEEEYNKTLKDLETEQNARLVQESQLQESLKAAGSVFDRDLFEKLVEKCGKGRSTPFGRDKMARFWEVLDRSFPKGKSGASTVKSGDEDKLLASLLGTM